MKRLLIVVTMIVALLAGPAQAVDPVNIGMITTLSTKAGYLGEEIRDGFQLAIDQESGRLGGVPVEHDMGAVFSLAYRITVLVYGQAIASGTPDEIRANQAVREAYLGDEAIGCSK